MPKTKRRKVTRAPRRQHRRKEGVDRARITRNALARQMHVQHSLVVHYMSLPGAPQPDKDMRFDPVEAEAWIKDQSKWAVGGMSPDTKKLRDRKLALEVEELEREASIRRGETIPLREYLETLEVLIVEVEGIYRQKFEHELPPKYQGKNEVERRQLNVKALAEAAEAFRSGKNRIEIQATKLQP